MKRWLAHSISTARDRKVAAVFPYGQKIKTVGMAGSYPIQGVVSPRVVRYVFWGDQWSPCGSADKWGELMEWARILAYITGTVDQELLLRNEYLALKTRSRGAS